MIRSAWKTLKAVAFVTYKEWAAYRSHMLLSLVVGPAFFLSQIFIWKAAYAGRDTLGGFTLDGMLLYYGAGSVIYYLTMDFADWNLQMLIRTGKFLTFMLRPVPHAFFAFSQKVGHRTLGFFFEFLPVYLIFTFLFGVPLVPARPFWAVLSIALSFVLLFFINYSTGILAFRLTRTDGIRSLIRLLRDLLAGVFLPLSFFPKAVQTVLFFLPFQFVSYVPTRVFLGGYELAGFRLSVPAVVGLQALMTAAMGLLTAGLWKLGVRRYTGVGV